MAELQLGRQLILELLHELDGKLASRVAEPATLVVVGGSYLALRNLRDSTEDIDSVSTADDSLRDAVGEIATERGLPRRWLNNHAYGFRPEGLSEEDCVVVLSGDGLVVLLPPPAWIFVMKLYAARVGDYEDMIALWPSCAFDSPQQAVALYESAYPHAPGDPGLPGYIAGIASKAEEPRQ